MRKQKLEKFVENQIAKNGNFENVCAEILLRKYAEIECENRNWKSLSKIKSQKMEILKMFALKSYSENMRKQKSESDSGN